ncbi:leukemia inhibitory factor receptor-like isoform 1-T1 [Menidia menidia]
MISWLLLLPLLCGSTHGNANDVLDCGPQNLSLNSIGQMLLLTWEDDPSCSALSDILIYKIIVFIADKQEHSDEVTVRLDQIGSTHSWNWTSHLPFECASHSVRLSSSYHNRTSPWNQERTLLGSRNTTRKVYPQDQIFEVGSSGTFCCVVPAIESIERFYLTGYHTTDIHTTRISNQMVALTVHFNKESDNRSDVRCQTNKTSKYGASIFADYAPRDRDFQCETQNLESVECVWTAPERKSWNPTNYQLLGRNKLGNHTALSFNECQYKSNGKCSQKMQMEAAGETLFTLIVQNRLGKVELQDNCDLTKRVYMLAPEKVSVSNVNARNVSLHWNWTLQKYNDLNLTCQLEVGDGDGNTIIEYSGIGLKSAVLTNLIPNWKCNVRVRCGTAQHFWKWGKWSDNTSFETEDDVPDAPDVWWMHKTENKTEIIWKMPLKSRNPEQIVFEVACASTKERDKQNKSEVLHKNRFILSLDAREEHVVTVTARNSLGSSSPSTITIPNISPEKTTVKTSWITGSNRGFNLSWPNDPRAKCGYIVDWRPTVGDGNVEWLKLPLDQTSVRITSEYVTDGKRYSLSIYACTQGAPLLLKKLEGYSREKRIEGTLFKSLKLAQNDSDVEISWEPIPLKEQTAFIQGYILRYHDNNGQSFSVSTDIPEATSLRATNLKTGFYTFTLMARTAFGECGKVTETLNFQKDNLIKSLLISMGIFFFALIFTAIFCFVSWLWIKDKVYKPVPKPVLTGKWLTSPAVHSCPPLDIDQSYCTEEKMDIPQLLCKLEPDDISQKAFASPPATLTLPFSPFRGTFANPTYNLMMQRQGQRSSSESDLQERTLPIINIGEYRPQNQLDVFRQKQIDDETSSSITCVSTYIMLPK